ncbi:MAG TPA: hypothetical protein VF920_06855 [Dongiaceae bacterium]
MTTLTPATIRFTGKTGQVDGPGIGDANVLGFTLATGDHFTLRLRDEDAIERQISLLGLREIGFQDVVNDMIVTYIFAWRVDATPGAMADVFPDVWRTLLGEGYRESHLGIQIARLARTGEPLLLVSILSGYGGKIAAVCRDIAWVTP